MFKNKYRIITDNYNGFQCDKKRWWFPFWIQVGLSNTHLTKEAAMKFIEGDGRVVATYSED